MDSRTFDRLVAEATRRPNRRTALRLLAGGLLGGLIALRGAHAHAQRVDGDGDGLFDDDETGVYGTDPGFSDSDGDGFGDGEEVYSGSNPLVVDGAVTADGNDLGAADPGPADTVNLDDATVCLGVGGFCADDGACCPGTRCCPSFAAGGAVCTDVGGAFGGFCPLDDGGDPTSGGAIGIGDINNGGNVPPGTTGVGDTGPVACGAVGAYCDYDAQCCNGGAGVNCCFDSVSLRTRCEDISARGACLEQ